MAMAQLLLTVCLMLVSDVHGHEHEALEFPVLDFSLPLSDLVHAFERALHEYGFFYARNHAIPRSVIDSAFNASISFFQQPLQFKQQFPYFNNRGFIEFDNKTGQTGFGLQSIPDQKEGFVLMYPQLNIEKPFYGRNPWPELNGFQTTFDRYKTEMDDLNMKLIQLFAMSLGFPQNYFFNGPNMLFSADQLLEIVLWHYMPITSNASNGIYATGEHSDWNFLSVLAVDDEHGISHGLQVQTADGIWHDLQHKKDLLIVNSGNMARVMTNGYYRSSYHRVLLQEAVDRYSMVYFISPNYEWKLNCIAPQKCNEADIADSAYRQEMELNAGQYLAKMFNVHTTGYSLKPEL